jgi:hypothetical protein
MRPKMDALESRFAKVAKLLAAPGLELTLPADGRNPRELARRRVYRDWTRMPREGENGVDSSLGS